MDLICSKCKKPCPDIILQVLAVPDLLNFPKGYRMLSQGNFCFWYFSKFLFPLGLPLTIPFLLSWFVLHDGCCNLGKILYLPISTFPNSLINDHFSGPNFSKAQAVQLIQRLSVEERRIFLKELKKVVPAPKHVQLTVSLLFRLTRDNHVQTNQHRGNYDS